MLIILNHIKSNNKIHININIFMLKDCIWESIKYVYMVFVKMKKNSQKGVWIA